MISLTGAFVRIAVASDHGGLKLKEQVKKWLAAAGHEVLDVGTYSEDSCDYTDFGEKAARMVAAGEAERGVLVCGTGIGMSLTANKIKGIRAALCTDPYMASMSRAHNNANILVLGERVVGFGLAEAIVRAWLTTPFEGGRHERRVEKIHRLES